VYHNLNDDGQKRSRLEDILKILRILWQGCLTSFIIEMKNLDIQQSEEITQQQV
jgi:predicted transcriptional regulator